MAYIFRTLASVLTLYSILCFVRIIITWIPGASYSRFGSLLSSICDPYLNLFRRFRFLTIGSFDFSPALALCLLGGASSLVNGFANGGKITVGMILGMAVEVISSILSSLISFLLIVLIIRVVIMFINGGSQFSGSPLINQLDRSISPLVNRIAGTFVHENLSYKKAILISIASLVVVQVVLNIVVRIIASLLFSLPF